MPPPIRALVVADAVASRRCVADALTGDDGIEVIGTAPNAKIGLTKVLSLRPDVVTVAPEMAEHGAMELVRSIRHAHPRLPVILFSCAGGASLSVVRELMAGGASAYIPLHADADRETVARSIRDELIPKIKALCTRAPERLERIDIVAIGISTGGPNALPVLLSALPGDFPVPVVIVQHMPPVFTLRLAERLNTKCAIEVVEAAAGEPLRAGRVSLAPGNFHLVIAKAAAGFRFELNQNPQENSCRPSVDPLFRSVAVAYGAHALGVMMTGMGRDGLHGCEAMRAMGGQIIAQDEATSVVWGMPGSVVRAGLAETVLPLESLASEIIRRVQSGRSSRPNLPAHVR